MFHAGNETADDIIRSALNLHKNFVQVTPDDLIQLVSVAAPHQKGQDELMQLAAQHMVLTLYRNQLMHVFVRIAMVTISINACPNDTLELGKRERGCGKELSIKALNWKPFIKERI